MIVFLHSGNILLLKQFYVFCIIILCTSAVSGVYIYWKGQ
jgi:hypothetical protein